MAFFRRGKWGVFTLLLLYSALLPPVVYQASKAPGVRWASYFLLSPLVASALLPFWLTFIVGSIALAGSVILYGFVVPAQPTSGRIIVVTAMFVAFVISLVVCKVREDRENRVKRLMIARERLEFLSAASSHVGSTLDVARTAAELTEVAVPRFADFVLVDMYDGVLQGEEPKATGPPHDSVTLRRVAQRSVLPGSPESVLKVGEADTYPEASIPAQCLATGQPVLAMPHPGDAAHGGLAFNPERTARVRDFGIHSGIAIPMRARGTTLGVTLFARHERSEPFDENDLLLAEEVVARAAVCVDNARRYTRERGNSLTLQRSLLPRHLPSLAALESASRYLPAGSYAGVGGDWFDVIPLSGARVALVVGDVVGHGLHASATMGRLRAAVHTLADIDLPPDELLTHLDDVVIRLRTESESGNGGEGWNGRGTDDAASDVGATCLYAVYDPVSRRCTIARAGHPLPVLVMPDGDAEFVQLPAGPPLGLGGLPFESVELDLLEGSLLALYTDGLIESRHRHDIDSGLQALRQVLSQRGRSLDRTCDAVITTLLDGARPTDDIALLIARTRALDASHVAVWDVANDPSAVARARDFASRQLRVWGLTEVAFTTELVVSELVTNAMRHAEGPIELRLIREKALICEVSDGSSTSPHLRRARILDEDGRGLFIVANLTERWGTRPGPGGKIIWAEITI